MAYLENAELFAHGRWAEAFQGYWSPGYSLLLVPAVWFTGDDRAALLAVAHLVQALLGLAALRLAIVAVQARAPATVQRAVFWGCAWVIVRWLTQEFLTPDLLLGVLVLCFVIRLPARDRRGEIWLGVLAGAAFIVKTSSWPWLVSGVAVALLVRLRDQDGRAFPISPLATGASIIAVVIAALSVQAGRATIGSVGPLNLRWYLGDLSRRTPDTDRGPHAAKRLALLPSGAPVPYFDFRPSSRTYEPWSEPEQWARGVPADSQPRLNATQAVKSWTQNAREASRGLLPICLGLALLLMLHRPPRSGRGWWSSALDRPLLLVGAGAALPFLVVHAEGRLLAPAALLILLGAWPSTNEERAPAPSRLTALTWVSRAAVASVVVNLALYPFAFAARSSTNADVEDRFHRYFDAQLERSPTRRVVIVGPADRWMGLLWRHRLSVDRQIGVGGAPQVLAMSGAQRLDWLRREFSDGTLGVGWSSSGGAGAATRLRMDFSSW